VHPGDLVILISYAQLDDATARTFQPRIVHVDEHNRIVHRGTDPAEAVVAGLRSGDLVLRG
jgi:aspartate 1-decarboxylase